MKQKPYLLMAALPPPHGGVATWTQHIMSHGFPDGNQCRLIDTKMRENRKQADKASFSMGEIFRTFDIFSKLINQLIKHRPHLLHISCSASALGLLRNLSCAMMAKILRIPVISHYRGNLQQFYGDRYFNLGGIFLRILVLLSRANIVESLFSLETIQNKQKIKKSSVFMLPNFVADNVFQHQVKNTVSEKTRHRALFVGWITQTKGCQEILEVSKQLPNIDFYLLGKMYSDMESLYQHLPNNVILLGTTNHEGVLKEMCQSDFLLFPSYTEGFPLSVVEAMSVGLPVIATRVGAIPEMIEEGMGGFLVEPRDSSALAEAIKKFISQPELKKKMGQFNREKSENHYRYSIVIQQLLKIYEQVISRE